MKTTILLALLLTGCATQTTLRNPNVTQAQATRDTMECRYEAMKVEASVQNPIIGTSMAQDSMRLCLQLRGYN